MAIPVLQPRVPKLVLPTDIMARIAAAGQEEEKAKQARIQTQIAQQTGLPLAQAQLQQRQQQIQQAQTLLPLKQQLMEAQAAGLRGQQQLTPAKVALLQAQARLAGRKAEDPFGGQILPGPAGQAQGVDILEQRLGANHPTVLRAKSLMQSAQKLQNARADFYSSNVALKNMPQLQKQQITQRWQDFNAQRQQQGLPTVNFQDFLDGPGGNLVPADKKVKSDDTVNHLPLSTVGAETPEQIGTPHPEGSAPVMHQHVLNQPAQNQISTSQATATPEDFKSESKVTQLKLAKDATNPQIFQQWTNFSNIVKTMQGIDPTIFARYTGPAGLARLSRDRASELAGTPVPGFDKYNNFVTTTLPTLTDNIRQAYGTSITPELFNILKKATNPITWKNSPDLAVSQWNELNKLMNERRGVLGQFVALNDKIKDGVVAAPTPTVAPTPSGIPLSDLQIDQLAKKHNLTREQVISKLRGKL